VLIATEPVAAQIFLGDESLGPSPVGVSVAEGQSVELVIRADGFKDSRIMIDGTEASHSIKLERTGRQNGTGMPSAQRVIKRPAIGGGEIIDPWSK
jgi:hypothetical protein